MNIGFLLDGFTGGGTARATSIIGNALTKRDNGINVYALGYTKDGKQEIYKTDYPVNYVYNNKISMQNAIIKHNYLNIVSDFVNDNNINILIACGVQFYPIATIIAKRCKIKAICWEHTNPLINTNFRFQRLCRWIGSLTSDCNVVLTKEALKIYKKWFPRKNNVQIYNAIDPQLQLLNSNYNPNSHKIISVGRLSEPKNFSRLIKIASMVLPQFLDWSWDIYGEGPLEKELQSLINSSHMNGRVTLKGQVSDLYERYSKYSFMVMTSSWEGFPMTLLEGAACSLPLIAFDIPTGPSEIIVNNSNGFICNSIADEEMVNAIIKLINNSELRIQMSSESKLKAQQFSVDPIILQWEELLHTL